MKLALFSLFFVVFVSTSTAQIRNDSLNVSFQLDKSVVFQPRDLDLKVIIKNSSNKPILVYTSLGEGSLNNNLSNFHIVIEQLIGTEFKPIWINQGVSRRDANSFDSLRHFDLPKQSLKPNDSDTLIFNLLNTLSFEKGKYRVKAFLRVNTIRNNQEYTDKNFESEPLSDKLIYLQSDWLNFKVKTRLRAIKVGLE